MLLGQSGLGVRLRQPMAALVSPRIALGQHSSAALVRHFRPCCPNTDHGKTYGANGRYCQRRAGLKLRCDTKVGTNLGLTLIGRLAELSEQTSKFYATAVCASSLSKVIVSLAAGYPFSIVHLLEFENGRRILFKCSTFSSARRGLRLGR